MLQEQDRPSREADFLARPTLLPAVLDPDVILSNLAPLTYILSTTLPGRPAKGEGRHH